MELTGSSKALFELTLIFLLIPWFGLGLSVSEKSFLSSPSPKSCMNYKFSDTSKA
jgi:hypothetical protein